MELKKELIIEEALKMTLGQVLDYYFPNKSRCDQDYILWNETCYPFDTVQTLKELYIIYKQDFYEKKAII